VALAIYPFANILGLLMITGLSLFLLVYGEIGDFTTFYQYALVLSPFILLFFFQLGFGLTGAMTLYLLTVGGAAFGSSYVERNSAMWATESAAGGGR